MVLLDYILTEGHVTTANMYNSPTFLKPPNKPWNWIYITAVSNSKQVYEHLHICINILLDSTKFWEKVFRTYVQKLVICKVWVIELYIHCIALNP